MEANLRIISWNVRGLNCPLKRGSVRWVLRRYSWDVAILLESELQEVDRRMVCSLWGRRQVKWVYLSSSGRSGGINDTISMEDALDLEKGGWDWGRCVGIFCG
uniref:Endonuclease/exonuclease/phosphatase domain-containing protein n=1 Tax=Opuntia streptacantha TaxID=393608 RepID=A0A7C8ZNH5_OPUST